MKKSTLLSLLTAGAVIATSAGTFATWDTLEANAAAGSITFDRINVTATATQQLALVNDGQTFHTTAAQSANAKINVDLSSVPADITTNDKAVLTFTPVVKDSSNQIIDSAKYTLTIKDTDGTTTLNNNKDTSLSSSATNSYEVVVTPTDTALAGQALTLSVDVALSEATAS